MARNPETPRTGGHNPRRLGFSRRFRANRPSPKHYPHASKIFDYFSTANGSTRARNPDHLFGLTTVSSARDDYAYSPKTGDGRSAP
jgi:hypothetical protein